MFEPSCVDGVGAVLHDLVHAPDPSGDDLARGRAAHAAALAAERENYFPAGGAYR